MVVAESKVIVLGEAVYVAVPDIDASIAAYKCEEGGKCSQYKELAAKRSGCEDRTESRIQHPRSSRNTNNRSNNKHRIRSRISPRRCRRYSLSNRMQAIAAINTHRRRNISSIRITALINTTRYEIISRRLEIGATITVIEVAIGIAASDEGDEIAFSADVPEAVLCAEALVKVAWFGSDGDCADTVDERGGEDGEEEEDAD